MHICTCFYIGVTGYSRVLFQKGVVIVEIFVGQVHSLKLETVSKIYLSEFPKVHSEATTLAKVMLLVIRRHTFFRSSLIYSNEPWYFIHKIVYRQAEIPTKMLSLYIRRF